MASQRPATARGVALDLLEHVLGQGRPLSEAGHRLAVLPPAERATAQRLATDVLRTLPRADLLLKPHLRKAPALRVRNILRLGVVELARGGAAHGVVNAAVDLAAADRKSAGAKGLVNAVLRKCAADAQARWDSLPVPRMAAWLRGPLAEAWGKKGVAAMERAHLAGAPIDVTLRASAADAASDWPARLGAEPLPTGSLRLPARVQVSALPGFAEGAFWVQDAAAALPVRLLGDIQGRDVLDMCAAPGGKTLQLAALGARVTALDVSEARMARVTENLARTGLEARTVVGDALTHAGSYDAVVLDAPCSATGTLRRHPDLPHASDGAQISDLIGLQAAMLDHAVGLLKPGGRLVFATCSLLPDEGECQVEAALERHPALRVISPAAPGIDPAWHSPEGGLRLRPDFWPERGGMDGFYMALMALEAPGDG